MLTQVDTATPFAHSTPPQTKALYYPLL